MAKRKENTVYDQPEDTEVTSTVDRGDGPVQEPAVSGDPTWEGDGPNPAVVPDPEPEPEEVKQEVNPALVQEQLEANPEAKQYKVPDASEVMVWCEDTQYWPGETFVGVFPPDQETRLIESGTIEVVDTTDRKKED